MLTHPKLGSLFFVSLCFWFIEAQAKQPQDLEFVPRDVSLVCQLDIQQGLKSEIFSSFFDDLMAIPQVRQFRASLGKEMNFSLSRDLQRVTLGVRFDQMGQPRTTLVYGTRQPAAVLFEQLKEMQQKNHQQCLRLGGTPKKCTRQFKHSKRGRASLEIDGVGWTHLSRRLISGRPVSTLTRNSALGRRKPIKSKSVLKSRSLRSALKSSTVQAPFWCVSHASKGVQKMIRADRNGRFEGMRFATFGVTFDGQLNFRMVIVSDPKTAQTHKNEIDGQWQALFLSPMANIMGLGAYRNRLKTRTEDGRLEIELELLKNETLRLKSLLKSLAKRRVQQTGMPKPGATSQPPPPGKKIKTTQD